MFEICEKVRNNFFAQKYLEYLRVSDCIRNVRIKIALMLIFTLTLNFTSTVLHKFLCICMNRCNVVLCTTPAGCTKWLTIVDNIYHSWSTIVQTNWIFRKNSIKYRNEKIANIVLLLANLTTFLSGPEKFNFKAMCHMSV